MWVECVMDRLRPWHKCNGHYRWFIPEMLLALSMLIGSPFSRFQVTMGVGLPVAWHSRVTSLPSVRTLSELLCESSILGGTWKTNVPSWFSSAKDCISFSIAMHEMLEAVVCCEMHHAQIKNEEVCGSVLLKGGLCCNLAQWNITPHFQRHSLLCKLHIIKGEFCYS